MVLFTAAAAALLAAPAAGAQRAPLMPGVTHERTVQFTPHGPVVAHVLRAPRPTGLYALKPVLAKDVIVGRDRVTAMQKRVLPFATVAGVNGNLVSGNATEPTGILMRDGVLAAPPHGERSSTGIAADGTLRVERVRFAGTWQGTGQRRPLLLNRFPGPNGVSLFTPAYGPTTPAAAGTVELVLQPFPPAHPLRDLVGTVVAGKEGGATPIPADGAVLVGRGANGAGRVAAEAPVGSNITVRLTLTPDWSGLTAAIGGGPQLVRQGRAIFRANELFPADLLVRRQPRTAVGQTADGGVLLVAVDGGTPGYSVGATNFELALLMQQLGAQTASALDGGRSTTMAFEGELLNRPSDPSGERAIAESLNVFYYGVHAPEPAVDVVSPNGDGVAERQALAYKVVRPSQVRARLVDPGGAEQLLDAGGKEPGTYRFDWAGPGPEGPWRFVVDATDDLGRASTVERPFSLNNTLASVRVETPAVRRGRTLGVAFTLARPAQVRASILTASGATLRTLQLGAMRAGPQRITWNTRNAGGSVVFRGRYEVRVTAQNEVGSVSQSAPFTVRP